MVLLLFWTKVAIRRIIQILKSSPAPVVMVIIFIGAVIYAVTNRHIDIKLDIKTIIIVISFLVTISIIGSYKIFNFMPMFIRYSKSKFINKIIHVRYFIKQAFLLNILFLVFCIIAYGYLTDEKYFLIIIGAYIFSSVLSFIIMYKKNNNKIRLTLETNHKRIKVNPLIKSAVFDYFTPDIFVLVIMSIVLFMIIFFEYLKDVNAFNIVEKQSVLLILMTFVFSFGLAGILESIPKINWKFQALISPNDFKYHLKRTCVFLGGMFAPALVLFIVLGGIINWFLLLKYLYCILALFMIAVNISLTISHIIVKGTVYLTISILAMWISSLPAVLLPVLLIPVILSFVKAKNEYKEWFLL